LPFISSLGIGDTGGSRLGNYFGSAALDGLGQNFLDRISASAFDFYFPFVQAAAGFTFLSDSMLCSSISFAWSMDCRR